MRIQERKTEKNWIKAGFTTLIIVLIVQSIFPKVIPFDTFQFWKNNEIIAGILASWPIFLWGGAVTSFFAFTTYNSRWQNMHAEQIFVSEIFKSAFAGVFEELAFRWSLFLGAIIAVKISNFLIFGWLGFGLAEFLHVEIFGAFVNFITFKKLGWLLFDMGWAVGAAALIANAKFRNGHAYLGIFGWLNSWIIGFFLFWIMFEYGLMTAIIVHFLYDILIDIICYVDMVLERRAYAREGE